MNKWTFSGKIIYIKELEGEFFISLKLSGTSKRKNAFSEQIAKISCLGDKDFFNEFKAGMYKLYETITISGHIEYWESNSKGKPVSKIMLIADSIE